MRSEPKFFMTGLWQASPIAFASFTLLGFVCRMEVRPGIPNVPLSWSLGLLGQRVWIFLLLLIYFPYCLTIKLYQFSESAVICEDRSLAMIILRVSWKDMNTTFPGFESQLCHLPFTICVTLRKLFNHAEPQLLPLQNGASHSIYLRNELVNICIVPRTVVMQVFHALCYCC